MDNNDIKLLLVRYITGEVGEEEIKKVKHWISLHPKNELYFIELYEVWQNMLYLKPETIDEEKAFALFLKKVSPPNGRITQTRWLKVAAMILVFIAATVLFFTRSRTGPSVNRQVAAQNGHTQKLLLADGTVVWLNSGSKLYYDAGFNKSNRTVHLEGEALFDVGHDNKLIPFIVKTKSYTIRDIGTRFNLKAYPDDPFFETTVIKGEVAVEDNLQAGAGNNNRIYVKPRQVLKIYYHHENGTKSPAAVPIPDTYNEVQIMQVDSSQMAVYDGWKDGVLVFDGNTLGEISRVLERRYNVQIVLNDDQLQNIKYSGSFKNVPDINSVLQIIKQNTPVNYVIEGHKVTITKTGH